MDTPRIDLDLSDCEDALCDVQLGDRPNRCVLSLLLGTNGMWIVYRDFQRVLTDEEFKEGGFESRTKPFWSFLVTNGEEQLLLYRNAGQNVITCRSTNPTLSVSYNLETKQAEQLSASLDATLEKAAGDVSTETSSEIVKPHGLACEFRANMTKFVRSSHSRLVQKS